MPLSRAPETLCGFQLRRLSQRVPPDLARQLHTIMQSSFIFSGSRSTSTVAQPDRLELSLWESKSHVLPLHQSRILKRKANGPTSRHCPTYLTAAFPPVATSGALEAHSSRNAFLSREAPILLGSLAVYPQPELHWNGGYRQSFTRRLICF